MFVILLAIYNSFSIPYNIAFKPPAFDSTFMDLFNGIIDGLFFVDIIISFRTTFINTKTGDEIWDPKLIAKKYVMGGRFWIDLLSSLPMDSFGSGDASTFLAAFGMLKLMRITRISRII